jgi:hypothetical protein
LIGPISSATNERRDSAATSLKRYPCGPSSSTHAEISIARSGIQPAALSSSSTGERSQDDQPSLSRSNSESIKQPLTTSLNGDGNPHKLPGPSAHLYITERRRCGAIQPQVRAPGMD